MALSVMLIQWQWRWCQNQTHSVADAVGDAICVRFIYLSFSSFLFHSFILYLLWCGDCGLCADKICPVWSKWHTQKTPTGRLREELNKSRTKHKLKPEHTPDAYKVCWNSLKTNWGIMSAEFAMRCVGSYSIYMLCQSHSNPSSSVFLSFNFLNSLPLRSLHSLFNFLRPCAVLYGI